MKFARLLRTTAEDLPELQCLFHIYKHLKKQLKQLPARSDSKAPAAEPQLQHQQLASSVVAGQVSHSAEAGEEAHFTAVLTDHLQRLNDRFLEREETCVIQLERLEAEATQCSAAGRTAAAAARAADLDRDGVSREGDETTAACGGVRFRGEAAAALKAVAEQRAQLYKRFVNFHGTTQITDESYLHATHLSPLILPPPQPLF